MQLKRAVGDWPAISTAIERLGQQDCITSSDVRMALQRYCNERITPKAKPNTPRPRHAAAKILLRLGDTYDGKVTRKSAQAGAAAFLDLVLPILQVCHQSGRNRPQNGIANPRLACRRLRPPSYYRRGSGFRWQLPRRRRMSAVFMSGNNVRILPAGRYAERRCGTSVGPRYRVNRRRRGSGTAPLRCALRRVHARRVARQ